MMTFVEKCLSGEALTDEIDDYINNWHEGEGQDLELHDYLGLTWEEYSLWGTRPSILSSIFSSRRKKIPFGQELKLEKLSLAARAGSVKEAKEMEEWLKKIRKI